MSHSRSFDSCGILASQKTCFEFELHYSSNTCQSQITISSDRLYIDICDEIWRYNFKCAIENICNKWVMLFLFAHFVTVHNSFTWMSFHCSDFVEINNIQNYLYRLSVQGLSRVPYLLLDKIIRFTQLYLFYSWAFSVMFWHIRYPLLNY